MLSCMAASSVGESMRVPTVRLNEPIHSLTSMVSSRTTAETTEKATGSGCRMRVNEVCRNCTPTTQMMSETISPAMYSVRP